MDRSTIDATLMAPRYLAGQLPAEEKAAFEHAFEHDPQILADLDTTLRFKVGLAMLRESGELAALMRPVRRVRFLVACAATLIALVIGGLFWKGFAPSPSVPAFNLLSISPPSVPLKTISLELMRTRGSEADVPYRFALGTGPVELSIVPSYYSSTEHYTVRMATVGTAKNGSSEELTHVPAGDDRHIRLLLDSDQLPPGTYELLVSPESFPAEVDQFTLQTR